MAINFDSPVPIYLQLANLIEEEIISGKLKEGDKIFSENIFSGMYGVSRLTVRHALEELIKKGYIIKKKGSGSFVSYNPKKQVSIFDFLGVTEAFDRENIELKKIFIDKLITKKIFDRNNPFYEKEVYYFSRLDIANDIRIIFEKFYFDREMFKNLEKFNLENVKISEITEKEYFLKPTKIKQNFKAILSDDYIEKIFNLKNKKTLLFLKREIFFGEKRGIYSEIFIDTDKFDFYQEIRR
ncbi:MAG: GntR family transcriptional regulator [Brevinematales bacterium]|nr:GntR family transcriptional regulator [Brevinematales bacterium]